MKKYTIIFLMLLASVAKAQTWNVDFLEKLCSASLSEFKTMVISHGYKYSDSRYKCTNNDCDLYYDEDLSGSWVSRGDLGDGWVTICFNDMDVADYNDIVGEVTIWRAQDFKEGKKNEEKIGNGKRTEFWYYQGAYDLSFSKADYPDYHRVDICISVE